MSAAVTDEQVSKKKLMPLVVGAIGVVYGDIGTSPLYAFKETFSEAHGLPLDAVHILDVLSLIFWTLAIIVTVKYIAFLLNADNKGEGGSFALQALASRFSSDSKWLMAGIPAIGIFAASLFYGDAMITPAISVLSAVEGLTIIDPAFEMFVLPITLFILIMLFSVQKFGTGLMGKFFGPITIIWFATIAAIGVDNIIDNPVVLKAVNPFYVLEFFIKDTMLAFLTMGTVVLCVTGAEALYADMGHFGKKPIKIAWLYFVWPCLILNYFGQGAFVMSQPTGIENPFYMMAPSFMQWPLLILATAATIIASQAVISGAFSLTAQAIQLGYIPRMQIIHTSDEEMGQIYVPFVNWALLVFIFALVIGFGSSSNMAAAYGVAVTGTMLMSTLLFTVIIFKMWKWHWIYAVPFLAILYIIDITFFLSTSLKITHGGWFPLSLGLVMLLLLTTWKNGKELVLRQLQKDMMPTDVFFQDFVPRAIRVPGTAIFMTRVQEGIPVPLLHNIRHNKILHERNIFLHICVEEKSYVKPEKRFQIHDLGQGFFRILIHYGFKDAIDVPKELFANNEHGFDFNMHDTNFFIGRETVIPTKIPGMALWREHLFSWMARNATSAADFYRLPSRRVLELGSRVDI